LKRASLAEQRAGEMEHFYQLVGFWWQEGFGAPSDFEDRIVAAKPKVLRRLMGRG
jgi:hypothetical protein